MASAMLRHAAHVLGPDKAPRQHSIRVCKWAGCAVEIVAPWLYCREHSREMLATRRRAWRERRRGAHLERDVEKVSRLLESIEWPPVEAPPGYCQHCGVIRLSRDSTTGVCDECHQDIQAALKRKGRR